MDHSVARDFGIDFERPRFDATSERLGLIKSLFAKPFSHAQGADAVMAKGDDPFAGVELRVRSVWHLTHRHVQAALYARDGELPRFAHVNEASAILAQQLSGFSGGNFDV